MSCLICHHLGARDESILWKCAGNIHVSLKRLW